MAPSLYKSSYYCNHFLLLFLCILLISLGTVTSHEDMGGGGEEEIVGKFAPSQNYTSSWVIHKGYINFVITVPIKGWIGIGFSDITGTDAIKGYLDGDNKIVVSDMWYKGDSFTNDWFDIKGVIKKGVSDFNVTNTHGTTLTFSRKLDSSDKPDLIIAKGDMKVKWAFGTIAGPEINESGESTINFWASEHDESQEMVLIKYHGIMMCTLVMIIMTAAMITSRYLKRVAPWWFYLHTFLGCFGLFIMVISLIVVFSAHDNKFIPSWHSAFGVIFIILMGTQSLLGAFAHFVFDMHRRGPPLFPDRLHWWLGRSVYFVGLLNIALGLGMLDFSGLGWTFYALWCLVIVVIVSMLEKAIGQTHETANGHKILEESAEEDKKSGGLKGKQQRKGAEFLVMFFVPAVTAILLTFMGVVMQV